MSDEPPGGALPPPIPSTQVESTAPGTDLRQSHRRRRIVVGSGIAAGVLLLPFAGFLAIDAATSEGGADSPEAAVQSMFDALGDEDVLGVMDALLPAERRSLGEPVRDIVDELRRLEILSEDADLGDVAGFDLEFEDLTFTTEEVTDGITVVEITGGTVDGAADLDQLPLGDLLVELGFDGDRPSGREQGSEPIGDGARIATVEEDGRWYVSLWFTAAEALRASSEGAAPDPGSAIEPVGAASPEELVDDLLAAAGRFDLTGVLAMLPPGEARALHVYAPLFLEDAEAALVELRAESGLTLDVEASEYEVTRDGDRATVVPTALTLAVEADGEQATIEVADGCATIEAAGEREEICTEDGEDLVPPDAELDLWSDLDIGFEVVEEGGRWYLSPTATIVEPFLAALGALDADDVRELVDRVESGSLLDLGEA